MGNENIRPPLWQEALHLVIGLLLTGVLSLLWEASTW